MAGVIKAGNVSEHGGVQAAAFSFTDMSRRADDYIKQIEAKGELLLKEAEQQAIQIRKDAEIAGQQDAVRAAQQAASHELNQKLKTLVPAIQKAIQDVDQMRQSWLRQWEKEFLLLSVKIAERIVRRELERHPDIPLDVIRETLEVAADRGRMTLELNPQDYETLKPRVAELVRQFGQIGQVDVQPDDSIEPGGCRLLTEYGEINQQVHVQLERIYEELVQ